MAKASQTLAVHRLNELINHFMQLHKSDQYNGTEVGEKYSVNKENTRNMPHTGQLKDRHTQKAWTQ